MDIFLIKFFLSLFLIAFILETHYANARPDFKHRIKRVSDTHITNLETKVAMNKFNGIAITLPIGFGRNLDYIGRKRRSQSRYLEKIFNQSEEEEDNQRENGIIEQEQEIYNENDNDDDNRGGGGGGGGGRLLFLKKKR